jgi:hypothetical protein
MFARLAALQRWAPPGRIELPPDDGAVSARVVAPVIRAHLACLPTRQRLLKRVPEGIPSGRRQSSRAPRMAEV